MLKRETTLKAPNPEQEQQPSPSLNAELFELIVENNEVFIKVCPPVNGNKANLDRIQDAVHDLDVDYLPERLLEIYENESDEFEKLCDLVITDYQFEVTISPDEQSASILVVPPTDESLPLTPAMLTQALNQQGVQAGILQEVLGDIVEFSLFREAVVVAEAQMPQNGVDGYFILKYQPETDAEQAELQVNHKEHNDLINVTEGQVLVEIVEPVKGIDGFLVTGRELQAAKGRKCRLVPGRHTKYTPDRSQIVATRNGFVIMEGNSLTVENILRVANVDSSTGNLHFEGILLVEGNVEDAFTAEATVRIDVKGSVGKATLKSQGDVLVSNGVLGGTIKAGGSVRAKFVSDSTIKAEKRILISEYILNSTLSAGELVHVTAPEGFLSGGSVHAGSFIKIPIVGSQKIGVETNLAVGLDPDLRKMFNEVESRLKGHQLSFEKLNKNLSHLQAIREKQGVLPPEPEGTFNRMLEASRTLKKELHNQVLVWRKLVDIIQQDRQLGGGVVFIPGTTYPGTVIQIKRLTLQIKSPVSDAAVISSKGKLHIRDCRDVYKKFRRYFER